jgi:hypothetical protein
LGEVICTGIASNLPHVSYLQQKGGTSMVKTFIAGLTFVVALGISGSAWSQGLMGSIVGTVRDPSNASGARARIIIKNVSTNRETQTATDADGVFRVVGLVPGDYTEASGFRLAMTSPQSVGVATPVRVDLTLEVGAVSEVISVETRATQVNTEDAQLGQVLRNVSQLPLLSGNAGRNPLALVGTQPGVTLAGVSPAPVVSTNALGPFSVNGQRTQANNYLLDGGDSNDLAINVPDSVQQISPDALEEFRVVTGAAKAEYGRNAGATIELVTKSGGNGLHGGLQETLRNKVLNAVPFFQKVTPGPVDTFTTGYELPFWKSRKHLLARIARGWGASLIVSAQTGVPLNIVESADRCLCDMPTSAQHPDFLGGEIRFYDPRNVSVVPGRPNSYFDGTGGGNATGGGNPFFRRVGSGNSTALGAGRLGSFGRNVFDGPGYANWDFDAFKRITIREHHGFEFRVQFLNGFNHTQFDAIGSSGLASIGSPNFGKVSSTLPPRVIQLSARYAF